MPLSTATARDIEVVSNQLGRPARDIVAIAVNEENAAFSSLQGINPHNAITKASADETTKAR